ncbi:MAG: acyltransferase family protein, partial [Lewinella sp.]|nr:acyltransferase family protein [Lewinella sp.]
MLPTTRRHDIDWLRVIAIWLLIIYHLGIGFQPWGVFIGFIQNNDSLTGLHAPMFLLNVWRIPLLFFVSGMGVCFAMRKRNWKELIRERTQRILIPLAFGTVAVVPWHTLLWQSYYHQDLAYTPHPGHLWFLANIFAYVLLLLPFFTYLKHQPESRLSQGLHWLFARPLVFLVIVLCFIGEAWLVAPASFEQYAYTWHGFWLGLLAFLFGYLMVYTGAAMWEQLRRGKWFFLLLAMGLYVWRLVWYDLMAPYPLMAIESNAWIFALFGLGYQYLNRPGAALNYLSKASYPIYILHMFFLFLGSYLLFPLSWPAVVKFVLVALFTFAGCYATYEWVIRRVGFLRPLFGLRPR